MANPKEVIASLKMTDGVVENLDTDDASVIIDALQKAGYVIVPREPSDEGAITGMPEVDTMSRAAAFHAGRKYGAARAHALLSEAAEYVEQCSSDERGNPNDRPIELLKRIEAELKSE